MRILHISDCYLPRLGGIEVQVADLVGKQREAGHTVEVATATPGEPLPGVRRVVAGLPFDLPVHPRGTAHLIRLMTGWRPDVVHVHAGAVSPFAWQGVGAAVRAGMPVVVTVHSMWDPITSGLYLGLQAAFEWRRRGIAVTTVSEAAAQPIRAVAGSGVPVHVVSNGLDVAAWRPDPGRAVPEGERGGAHVVAVGRLAPRKQPVRLLKLLKAARASVPETIPMRATIVGEGPARGSMERYLRGQEMDWVALPGRFTRDQIKELLASADVFVAPAPRESFGLAALEARAAGVPVVARSQSGVADFVRPGKEGLLGRTFDELASSIARLVRDEPLRASIAAHNREVEPVACSWPAVLDGFERCYAEVRGARP
ncbi:glycosyltransferase family 4 protein [Microtetraspora malaysiensis]|uniref:glycosyltransferase family 4 protein n=1 Tax=Microtetraspora malaysiensis TaxID=161358 RepID=UPI0008325FC1|nr:glycosyltransferase family 4 protein [Microtetraspora malaysiensis]